MDFEVDIDFWTEYFVRYDVVVNLTDARGNAMDPEYRTQVDGLFAGVLEFFEWLGGAVAAVANAVVAALSFVASLVKEAIAWLLNSIMNSIADAISGMASDAQNLVLSNFRRNSPVQLSNYAMGANLIGFVAIPLIVASAVTYGLAALEVALAFMSAGATNLIANFAMQILQGLIYFGFTVAGMVAFSQVNVLDPSGWIQWMGDWGLSFALAANAITATSLLYMRYKLATVPMPTLALALMAFANAILSTRLSPCWVRAMWGLLVWYPLTALAAWKATHSGEDMFMKKFAPLSSLLGQALAAIDVVLIPVATLATIADCSGG